MMRHLFILMFNYQTVHLGKNEQYATFFATFYAKYRVNRVEHFAAMGKAAEDMARIGY